MSFPTRTASASSTRWSRSPGLPELLEIQGDWPGADGPPASSTRLVRSAIRRRRRAPIQPSARGVGGGTEVVRRASRFSSRDPEEPSRRSCRPRGVDPGAFRRADLSDGRIREPVTGEPSCCSAVAARRTSWPQANCATACFNSVFTSPAAGDMGTGLGAALLHRQRPDRGRRQGRRRRLDLGSLAAPGAARRRLPIWSPHAATSVSAAARLLAEGKRRRLGARANGTGRTSARGSASIFADPRAGPACSPRSTRKIKFRRIVPPVCAGHPGRGLRRMVRLIEPSDYMQSTRGLKPEHRPRPPAAGRDDLARTAERSTV